MGSPLPRQSRPLLTLRVEWFKVVHAIVCAGLLDIYARNLGA